MTDESSDRVGSVSVDIVGDLAPLEEALARARQMVDEFAGKESSPVTESARRGKRGTVAQTAGTASAAQAQVNVDAKVKARVEKGVAKEIQDDLLREWFDIQIDTGSIRKQVQMALTAPFDITINAEVRGAAAQAGVGTAHGAAVTTGGPSSRGATPQEIVELMQRKGKRGGMEQSPFVGGIDAVYRNLNEVLQAAGRQRFGRQGLDPGNQVEKAIEMVEQFGSNVSEWVKFTSGTIPKPTGGGTIMDWLGSQGVGAPERLGATTNIGALGGDNRRAQELFFTRLSKWVSSTPMTALPAAAAEPIAAAVTAALKPLYQVGGEERPTPASDTLAKAQKTLQTALANLPFQSVEPVDLMKQYAVDRAVGFNEITRGRTGPTTPRPDDDPEATARANRDLGPGERANVRRLIGGFVPREINGQRVDLEPLLRAARGEGSDRGAFSGFFRTKEGDLKRYAPTTEDEAARVEAAQRGRSATVAGVGRVQNIPPSEAFWDAVTKVYDDEITAQLRADPAVANLVRQSLTQGAARRPLVEPHPGATNERGGIISSSAGGFEGGYRAAFRLKEVLDQIDDAYAKLEQRQGSGKSTSALETRLQALHARRAQLSEQALDITPRSPAEGRALAAAQRARDAQVARDSGGRYANASQRAVGEQVGLTEEDIARRVRSSPYLVGKAGREDIEAGRLPDLDVIKDLILAKYADPGFAGRRVLPGGMEETFPESSAQAMRRAYREVTDPLRGQLPEKGPVRKRGEQMLGDVYRGLFGENERFEVPANASMRVSNRSRTGGMMSIANEEAERAAKLADAGKGRGWVAKTAGFEYTGASANSGVAEGSAVPIRPTTGLDRERQTLMKKYENEARRVATERVAAREAARAASGVAPEMYSTPDMKLNVEDFMYSPAIASAHGAKKTSRGIRSSVRREVESTTDVGKRMAEIRAAQAEANTVLKSLSSIEDIDQQRAAAMVSTTGPDAYRDIQDVLRTRTAGKARSSYTRNTKDPVSGDEMRARWTKAGGMAAATAEGPVFRDFNAGEGSGPPGSGRGFGEVSGPIHVIIDRQPIRVTMAAASGGGRPPRGRVTAEGGDEQPPEGGEVIGKAAKNIRYNRYGAPIIDIIGGGPGARRARMDQTKPIGVTTTAAERYEAEQRKLRLQRPIGVTTTAAQRAAKVEAEEAAVLADLPFKLASDELKAQATADRRARIEERRQATELARARRGARVNDPIGFATQRDIADSDLAGLRGQNRAIQRRVPRRGFGASLTDLVTSVVGGGALERQLEAADRAQRELSEINQAAEKRSGFLTQRRGVLQQARAEPIFSSPGVLSERRLGLREQAAELKAAATAQTQIIKQSTKVFEENAGVVRKNTAAAFTAAAAGSVVSTGIGAMTVGLGMALAAPIIQGIGEGVMTVVDKALGSVQEISAVRTGLGAGTRAAGGQAAVAVAQQAGASGLSGATFRDVAPILTRTAAIEAGNTALKEQLETLRLDEDAGKRGPEGGISQTLGGLFGTPIGGTAPAMESIAGFLNAGRTTVPTRVPDGTPLGLILGLASAQTVTDFKVLGQRIGEVNQFLDKGSRSLIQFTEATGFSREAISAQANDLERLGMTQLSTLLRGGTTAITDRQGDLASAADISRAFSTAVANASKPSAEASLAADEPQRRAQRLVQDMQRRLQIDTILPQSFAMAEAANPLKPAATGINTAGLSPAQAKAINAELAVTQGLYDDINAEVASGIANAKAFVASKFADPKVGEAFGASLSRVVSLGKEISQIEIDVQTKQAAYAAEQYVYQIGLAKRSLADAKGLTGQLTDASKDNLGVIERQTFMLQRQSQGMGLDMSQRQINFQQALAGFQAPGLTAEERGARMDQAKVEADYAQKQLNIQRQLFGLGGRQFNIAGARQVRDLGRQIDLLEKGRVLTLETAASQARVTALGKDVAKESKNVEAYYQAAVTRTGDFITEVGRLVATSSSGLNEINKLALDAFQMHITGITGIIEGGFGGAEPRARGRFTPSAFSVTPVAMPGQSGVTIQINNPSVRNDGDITKIVSQVKAALQKEASLLLPRRP